mgnify:CR=1 FL=1
MKKRYGLLSMEYRNLQHIRIHMVIIKYKPDAIIGFGGYPSFAPIVAGKIFNIPSIIHEQNTIIGRANNLLSKISNLSALSFVDTKRFHFCYHDLDTFPQCCQYLHGFLWFSALRYYSAEITNLLLSSSNFVDFTFVYCSI